jgi:hypothetical protein
MGLTEEDMQKNAAEAVQEEKAEATPAPSEERPDVTLKFAEAKALRDAVMGEITPQSGDMPGDLDNAIAKIDAAAEGDTLGI